MLASIKIESTKANLILLEIAKVLCKVLLDPQNTTKADDLAGRKMSQSNLKLPRFFSTFVLSSNKLSRGQFPNIEKLRRENLTVTEKFHKDLGEQSTNT